MEFTMSQKFIQKAIFNQAENQQCCDLHPGSCNKKALVQLIGGTKAMSGVYFAVHFIPLILKYKKVLKNPSLQIRKSAYGFVKSMLFVASSLFLIRRLLCLFTRFYKFKNTTAVYTGFVSAFPLLLESPGRQIQISLFTLNKITETLYLVLRRRYPWLYIKYGQIWLMALSSSILSYYYLNDRQLFRSLYQKVLDLIFKDI